MGGALKKYKKSLIFSFNCFFCLFLCRNCLISTIVDTFSNPFISSIMAKGNMLLGYARGSVGDVTFYRDGGTQKARARNRQPANPRTNKQMTQRALFANCVKFHKLAASKFFKFAFENKKPNESDYNAFMRENIKRGVMMSKSCFDDWAYPALGNWVISRGSLTAITGTYEVGSTTITYPFFELLLGSGYTTPAADEQTIGWFSNLLITNNPSRYHVGDIITMVACFGNKSGVPAATPPENETSYEFMYWQFLIDVNNTTLIEDLTEGYFLPAVLDSGKRLGIDFMSEDSETFGNTLIQCGIIHSRNVSGGLLVSTCEMTNNPSMDTAITACSVDSYKQSVLDDWNAAGLAILQGEGLTPFPRDPWQHVTKSVNVTFTNNETGTSLITHNVSRVTKNNIATGGTKALDYSLCLDFETEDDAISVFNATAGTSVSDTEKEVSIRAVYSSGKTFTDNAAVMERTGATIIIDYSGNGNDYLILSGIITFDWYLDDVLVLSKAFAHADNVDIFEVYNTVTGSTYSWSDVISGKSTGQNVFLAVRAFNLEYLGNVSKYFKVTRSGLSQLEPTWSSGDYGIKYTNSWLNIQSLPASLRLETDGAEYENLEDIDVPCEFTA